MRQLIRKTHESDASDTLTLDYERRQKSRQRAVLDSGGEVGILLAPGTKLRDGDVLVDAAGQGVRVRAAEESLSEARADQPSALARAAYHLGNRHVPVEIGEGCVRYAHDHVLDDMLRGLGFTVLAVRAPFEPEGGAYGGHSHAHGHHHHSHDP